MNELETDFEFVPLANGGLFTPANRAAYETVVRRRGKEGWQVCTAPLVTLVDEAGKGPCPGIYMTFIKADQVMNVPFDNKSPFHVDKPGEYTLRDGTIVSISPDGERTAVEYPDHKKGYHVDQ